MYIYILYIHSLGITCYNDSQVLLTLLVTLIGPKTGTFFLQVKLAATNWASPGSVTVLYFFAINWSDWLSKMSKYMAKINISKNWMLYFLCHRHKLTIPPGGCSFDWYPGFENIKVDSMPILLLWWCMLLFSSAEVSTEATAGSVKIHLNVFFWFANVCHGYGKKMK